MSSSNDNNYIHPSAVIDEGAIIGTDSKVWHFSHVMSGAVIGKGCILGQNTFVANARIGDNVKIQNNVSIYEGVEIENNVFVGPSVVFTNVINPRSEVNRKSEYKRTWIKEGVTIGANATVLCGVTLGAYSFVGAGAVVTKDVPDYALIKGNPAVQDGWMSQAGQRLVFNDSALSRCSETNEQYKIENNLVIKIT